MASLLWAFGAMFLSSWSVNLRAEPASGTSRGLYLLVLVMAGTPDVTHLCPEAAHSPLKCDAHSDLADIWSHVLCTFISHVLLHVSLGVQGLSPSQAP